MRFAALFLLLAALVVAPLTHAGQIVANHDEWPTSNTGFSFAGSGATSAYVLNVADFFTGGGTGNFLVYSNNFAYASEFQNTLTGAGHSVTLDNSLMFTAANLAPYDAVFLAGLEAGYDTTEAINYVNAGGGIYLAGGTADGFNAGTEAAFWNPLLNNFGLQYAPTYNGISGVQAVSGPHPILSGVSQLYYNNGNTVSLFGSNPFASIILNSSQGAGLLGVYDSPAVTPVPESGTMALVGLGLAGVLVTGCLRARRTAVTGPPTQRSLQGDKDAGTRSV